MHLPWLCFSGFWQINEEPGSPARSRNDVHFTPVVIRNDKIGDRQPKPCSLANGFGGKKGLKNPLANRFIHTRPIVFDFNHHIRVLVGNLQEKPGRIL